MLKKLIIPTLLLSTSLLANNEQNIENFLQTITKQEQIVCKNNICQLNNLDVKEKNKENVLEQYKIEKMTINLNYTDKEVFVFNKNNYIKANKKCTKDIKICKDSIESDKLSQLSYYIQKINIKNLSFKTEKKGSDFSLEELTIKNDNDFFLNKDISKLTMKDFFNYNFSLSVSNLELKSPKDIIINTLFKINKNSEKRNAIPTPKSDELNQLLKEKYDILLSEYMKENKALQTINLSLNTLKNKENGLDIILNLFTFNNSLFKTNSKMTFSIKDITEDLKYADKNADIGQILQVFGSFLIFKKAHINIEQHDLVKLNSRLEKENKKFKDINTKIEDLIELNEKVLLKENINNYHSVLFNYITAMNKFNKNELIITNPNNAPIMNLFLSYIMGGSLVDLLTYEKKHLN